MIPFLIPFSLAHQSCLNKMIPCPSQGLRNKSNLWIDWLKEYALNKIVVILSLPLIFLKCVSLKFQRSRLCIREQKGCHFKTGSVIGVKVYNMPLPAS